MPLGNPGEGSGFESPIEDGTYSLYCIEIRDDRDYGYGPTLMWDFNVYDRTAQTPVLDADGELFIMGVLTSDKVTHSEKGNSKAYDFATALLNTSIDEMSGEEIAAGVIGKWALGTIVHNAKGFPNIADKGMKPWTEPKATPAPARAAAPAGRGAPRQPVAAGVTEEEAPPFE